ncbi:MAG: methyltransferase domain-containing protein [Proteobacteria bacterium]|nr:methyltransferase domain-containing protein [Pseudomonadota bacterium]
MTELVCPGCRTRTPERLDVRTLSRDGDILACACGRRYPIVDGVPIVMAPMRAEIASVIERDLAPEVAALLVADGPDDAPYARLLEHLSIYLDAQWGDHATPPPDGPGAGHAAALLAKLVALPRVGLAVELGCSVGRFTAELAARADEVVAVDLHHGALRRARRLLAGEPIDYARRVAGRHYTRARITPPLQLVSDNVTFVCGDALDPPLIPAVFDRVIALNLLDSIANPRQLLSVVDALCAPGGELILASPYTWQSSVMPEHHRIGGADPATAVRQILEQGLGLGTRYRIEDEADVPWTLRRDARSAATYCIHYMRARAL